MRKILDFLKKNKVAKAGIGYTFGSYLLKGLGFITVPIFSRLLTTEDFGIFNTFLAYEGILYLFVGLALHSSIKNAKYEYGDDKLDSYTSSIAIVPAVIICVLMVIGNVLDLLGINVLSMDSLQLNMLFLYSFSSSILYIYRGRLIMSYRTMEYLWVSYFNVIFSILLSVILVLKVFPEERYVGRILGTTIPMLMIALWIFLRLFKKAKPKVNLSYWQFGLKISLPIIPHGIGQVLLSSFDRIMITNMIGASDAGLYSFAYTIYSIVLVAGNSVATVFEPWAFERMAENKNNILIKRSGQIVLGLAALCALTMLIAPELVIILGSEKYRAAIPAVMPVLLGGFFSMAYTIPAVVEYYHKKTLYIAVGTCVATGINIFLNAIFIPQFGYIAAAYTTLVSYFLYFMFHAFISRRLAGFFIITMKNLTLSGIVLTTGIFVSQVFTDSLLVRYGLIMVCVILSIFVFMIRSNRMRRQG